VEPLGKEVQDDDRLWRRRVQADAVRGRGRGREGHHAEARRGVDGEAGALRRGVDQLQRPPGSPGQAVEHWVGSFAPDERHVLPFFMYVHGGARSGPAGCSMICLPGVSCVSLNLNVRCKYFCDRHVRCSWSAKSQAFISAIFVHLATGRGANSPEACYHQREAESKLMDFAVTLLFLYAIPIHEVTQDMVWWGRGGMGGTTEYRHSCYEPKQNGERGWRSQWRMQ